MNQLFCCHVAVGDMAPRLCVIMKMGGKYCLHTWVSPVVVVVVVVDAHGPLLFTGCGGGGWSGT